MLAITEALLGEFSKGSYVCWQPTPVLLPGKSHGWRSLVGCSQWSHKELDRTEQLHFHFSLSCIREGNGNLLQCSCLENPRDGEALWVAVYEVAQSQTRLKRLSSSSSSSAVKSLSISLKCLIRSPVAVLNCLSRGRGTHSDHRN